MRYQCADSKCALYDFTLNKLDWIKDCIIIQAVTETFYSPKENQA